MEGADGKVTYGSKVLKRGGRSTGVCSSVIEGQKSHLLGGLLIDLLSLLFARSGLPFPLAFLALSLRVVSELLFHSLVNGLLLFDA